MKGVFSGINKILIILGTASALLWGWGTWMSFGIPQSVCAFLDKATFGLMHGEVMRMAYGFHYDTNNHDMPTVIFLIVFAVLFLIYLCAVLKCEKSRNGKYALGIILFFAVIFRIILLPGVLIHENDIYRYLWDGKSAIHNINPYKYAPADLFMYESGFKEDFYDEYRDITIKGKDFTAHDKARLDKLIALRATNPTYYARIGHWQVPTIYPPVAQFVFALSAWLKADSIILMKIIFALFDLGVISLIILLLKYLGKDPRMCIVYAWSPLVLKEFANSGHYDPVVIFFSMAGIYLFLRKKAWQGMIVVALATLSKFFSVVFLPFLTRRYKKSFLLIFIGIVILAYYPFFLWDRTGVHGVFEGLTTYNQQWAYNASLFALVRTSLNMLHLPVDSTMVLSKLIVAVAYFILLIVLFFKNDDSDTG
ncbi:MAG: DUF2029 domain-containing protein, partial [Candidatus Omnitrophica bacterium]|nr:DUF2029 domain-containing protein [Candidatus Omnitrophota bacterium]